MGLPTWSPLAHGLLQADGVTSVSSPAAPVLADELTVETPEELPEDAELSRSSFQGKGPVHGRVHRVQLVHHVEDREENNPPPV